MHASPSPSIAPAPGRQGWLILADDLTGAADCGIAFARRGLAAQVGWHGSPPTGDVAVTAIDADSRRLPPDEAAARHVALLRRHLAPGPGQDGWEQGLIKKIDSTLRGQPVAELAATLGALRAAGRPALAVVAPAFPATGRTTEGGRVQLDGAPLESTPLWARDHSYAGAHLPSLLDEAGLRTRSLDLSAVRAGTAALRATLEGAIEAGFDAVVCDAARPADLDALARAGLPLRERVLWVGSGGIAAALAAALPGAAPARAPAPLPAPPAPRGGVLVVVGSVAEASRAAAARLEREGAALVFDVPPALLRAGADAQQRAALAAGIAGALAAGRDTLVRIGEAASADLCQGAALAEALAALLAPAARHMGGLFATGGETACALLTRLGVHGIRLLD